MKQLWEGGYLKLAKIVSRIIWIAPKEHPQSSLQITLLLTPFPFLSFEEEDIELKCLEINKKKRKKSNVKNLVEKITEAFKIGNNRVCLHYLNRSCSCGAKRYQILLILKSIKFPEVYIEENFFCPNSLKCRLTIWKRLKKLFLS